MSSGKASNGATANPALAQRLVDVLRRPDGSPTERPVHTLGIGAKGSFEPSPIAARYCIAPHFRPGRTPVTVRFSNGSGSVTPHDGWSDVRGMATRFHLGESGATDLIAMTLPEFFTSTGERFLDFAEAAKPVPYTGASPWQKIKDYLSLKQPRRDPYPGETISPDMGAKRYGSEHSEAQLAVFQAATIGAPVSYVRAAYHAVHSFVVTAPDGVRRWVRFTWQPVAGVLTTNPMATPVDEYLKAELRQRLSGRGHDRGEARFTLMMQVADAGDAVNDSTTPWPPHRERIAMGVLTLDRATEPGPESAVVEAMSFNPWLLPNGIDASDDPVLAIRKDAYEISSRERDGVPCPFSGTQSPPILPGRRA